MPTPQEQSLNQKLDNLQLSISTLLTSYRNRGNLLQSQAEELIALKANPQIELGDEEARIDNLLSTIQAELDQPEPSITIPGQVVENPTTHDLEESNHPEDQRPLDIPEIPDTTENPENPENPDTTLTTNPDSDSNTNESDDEDEIDPTYNDNDNDNDNN